MEWAVKDVLLLLLSPLATVGLLAFAGKFLLGAWERRTTQRVGLEHAERLKALELQHQRDLESFRQSLQAAHGRELERFRHELSAVAHERDERVRLLVAKRADIAGDLYARLARLKRTAHEATRILRPAGKSPEELYDGFSDAYQDLHELYEKTRPFVPTPVCRLIDDFASEALRSVLRHEIAGDARDFRLGKEASDHIAKRIVPALEAIEREIRLMLEVQEPNPPAIPAPEVREDESPRPLSPA